MIKTITKFHAFRAFLKGSFFLTVLILNQCVFAQNPFWTEDFSDPALVGWTNEDLSGNGVLWEHCNDPFACAPIAIPVDFLEEPRFMSTSTLSGYLFVESNNKEPHTSVLRSPKIDCSLHPNRVVLKFETHIAVRKSPPNETAILNVKSESSNWIEFKFFENLGTLPDIFGINESCNAEVIYLDITDIAAGQSEVELEWRWEADHDLSWALDDIELYDFHPLEKNVIWGKQPGEGDFSGGFNNWETNTISSSCDWYWEPTGWVGNSFFSSVPNDLKICSRTGNNGAAVIHPDLCSNGNSPVSAVAELISPTIDLSNFTNGEGFILEFDQLYAEGNPVIPNTPMTRVMYSVDDGQNWLDTLDCNPTTCFGAANFENSTFRAALPPEVLGTPEFKLKFVFQGDFFFWVIDDVRILEKQPFDLRVNRDFFAIPPTAQIPVSQFEPFGLMSDVENVGNETAENVRLLALIQNENGETVYSDSLFIGEMIPGEIVENMPFEKLADFEPTGGKFKGIYRIEADSSDGFPSDNEIVWDLNLTQGLFAKEIEPCEGTGFLPNDEFIYELGNCYFVANGEDLAATQVSFQFIPQSSVLNQTVFTNFYRWNGDANGDFKANPGEYNFLAVNEYKITGDEDGLVTIPIDVEKDSIPLSDDTFYFVTVNLSNPSQDKFFVVSATEKLNYNPSFFLSYELGKGELKSFPMLRLGQSGDFDAFGYGLDRIPVVRLHVESTNDTTSVFEPRPEILDLALYPNPASNQLNIAVPDEIFSGFGDLEILDNSGKIVFTRQFERINVKQLPINVAFLPEGSYILRLISKEKIFQQKFTKF